MSSAASYNNEDRESKTKRKTIRSRILEIKTSMRIKISAQVSRFR